MQDPHFTADEPYARAQGNSPEELYARAQGNANALTLATIAYLKQHDLPVAEWATDIGRRFARSWTGAVDPARAARGMAMNVTALGGRVVGEMSDEAGAEITYTDFPPDAMLAVFGVAREEADAAFGGITAGLMEAFGLRAAWRREGERVTLRFSR